MPVERIPKCGIKVSMSEYAPLKAFQGGGYFWDTQPQQIIRNTLGEFLPAVNKQSEGQESFGLFSHFVGTREVLSRSAALGGRKIPAKQLRRLEELLGELAGKIDSEGTQLTARDLIQKFRLPDPAHDPELYRITGFWWNRRLYILWGCERQSDSSLQPTEVIPRIPRDDWHGVKQALALLLLLIGLILLPWLLAPTIKSYARRLMNKAPLAALRLDSKNETNHVAVVSDGGSQDPDGEIKKWKIDWGDGNTESYANAPISVTNRYQKDGDYLISLTCVDNYGVTNKRPATVDVHFDFDKVSEAKRKKVEAATAALELERRQAEAEAKGREEARLKAQAESKSREEARLHAEALARTKDEDRRKAEAEAKVSEQARLQAEAENRKLADEKRLRELKSKPPVLQPAQELAPKTENPDPTQRPTQTAGGGNPATESPQRKVEEPDKGGPRLIKGFEKARPSSPEQPPVVSADTGQDQLTIKGIGKGKVNRDGSVEVTMVAMDGRNASAYLPVESWTIGNQTFTPKEPVFRTSLDKGEHPVKALVRTRDGRLRQITGVVKVNTAQTGEFILEPSR